MSFLSSLNISASGMTAQRLRLDVASENIANIETTRTENGGPYRKKLVVLQAKNGTDFSSYLSQAMEAGSSYAKGGVQVSQIFADERTSLKPVYNPEHPDANDEGYVMMPNIDLIEEVVDGMAATRSYEANITAFNAIKLMAQKALEIGK